MQTLPMRRGRSIPMKFKPGDEAKVTAFGAPFIGREVTVVQIDELDMYPIMCSLTVDGDECRVGFREHELELLDADAVTQEIPVVVA